MLDSICLGGSDDTRLDKTTEKVLELIDEEWKEIGKLQKGRYRHAAVGLHVTPDLMAACA